SGAGRPAGAPRWLAAHGLLYALPGRRGGGGHRLPSQQGAADYPGRRFDGRRGHVLARNLDLGAGLPIEYCWTAHLLLAGVHCARLRVDDPVGRAFGGLRHAGAERPAVALPSAVQRAQLPQRRDDRQVLPLPGGPGPQVRPDRDPGLSGYARTGLGGGGGVLMIDLRMNSNWRSQRPWRGRAGRSSLMAGLTVLALLA